MTNLPNKETAVIKINFINGNTQDIIVSDTQNVKELTNMVQTLINNNRNNWIKLMNNFYNLGTIHTITVTLE